MSLGFQTSLSTVINPLDQAVQAVWNSGIAVVVSAGNAGSFNGTILSPGDDPSVVSLAAPGSTIYDQYPSARIGSANFVGSGTSFSSAITSGAAALVLADNQGLSPNQLKARLLGTTSRGPVGNPFADGHGALDAYAAATAGPMNLAQPVAGLLPALPGTTVRLSPSGSADTWNASLWSGTSWSPGPGGSAWNGMAWNGDDWNGFTWTGRAWNSSAWD